MSLVPISSFRLLLRALRQDDLDAVFALLGDQTTTARMSWRQTSREATQAWLERRMRDEEIHGLSMWAVEDRELHQLIGLCGFFPRGEPELALGYVIAAPLWGRGLASEAVAAAVGAAMKAGYQVYATIRPWNTASLRVAEKVGLQRSGSVEDERGELLVFRTDPRATVV